MNTPPLTPAQVHDLADLAREDARERDQFDGADQLGNPARPTRCCTMCGHPEGKRRDLRATQFVAEPRTMPKTPTGQMRWSNVIDWACQPCRRKWQGAWRVPSYHPHAGVADFECYADQLVPGVRCLTLQEPWAWIIAQGFKDCENRPWHTKVAGRFFIHSGKSFSPSFDQIAQWVGTHKGIMLPGRAWLQAHHMGRIVAVAHFDPMVSHLAESDWKMKGQWAWPIRWCHSIPPSQVVRGMQGIWYLPTDHQRFSLRPA